jgi:hypothetical protein
MRIGNGDANSACDGISFAPLSFALLGIGTRAATPVKGTGEFLSCHS